MKKIINRFLKDESGVTAIEYGLIASLVGVAIILGATFLGGTLNGTFQMIGDTMAAAGGSGGASTP